MNMEIFDATPCRLGEGPLWHPVLDELFWFDIVGQKLHARKNNVVRHWSFDGFVSAAGWIDKDHLLIANQSKLFKFHIQTGRSEIVAPLERDNPVTRSNDGRADPWGGFWIGTMGLEAEHEAGSIYRYYRGELRRLYPSITISNSICFSPDRRWGYFADTGTAIIWRQVLEEKDGWPVGEPEVFVDFTGFGINPDGAVCDADGNLWSAQWGSARVVLFSQDGEILRQIDLPTDHITCPAFGGVDMKTLFITCAREGLSDEQLSSQPQAGMTFMVETETVGQKEHQVIL